MFHSLRWYKMRKKLKKIEGVREKFIGVFSRFGTKANYHGFPEPTILLIDIRNKDGEIVTDHIWFAYGKRFEALGELKEGDIIEFHARVKEYEKGYINMRHEIFNAETDYKLNNPTKVQKVV